MTLATTVTCLGGIPAPEIIADAVSSLVRPLVADDLVIADGPSLTEADYQAQIAELVSSRPQFSATGKRKAELVMTWMDVIGVDLSRTGWIASYTNAGVDSAGPLVEAMVASATALEAPLAYLDDFDGGIRPRLNQHRDVYQADKVGLDRVFGLARGFTGVPWRTLMGPASVEFFGTKALQSLSPTLAEQIADDRWLLTPCESPSDWTADRYCEGERRIIETLGADRFFDPESQTLPTQVPQLPEVAAIAVKARSRADDGNWQWHFFNGYAT